MRRRRWADRERYVTEHVCSVCRTVRALRRDGNVRVHPWPSVLPVPSPKPPRRVVTQK